MAITENQKDLVLAPNEFSYVLDQTKGNISCWVGPAKTSLSQSDSLVKFDKKTKQFIECSEYREAIQLFVTAPEGYYIALKNPAPDNKHPKTGTSNITPEDIQIGRKINIKGPANFALFPGQIAQVIKGHSLRSNQYLKVRIYDAGALAEEGYVSAGEPYVNGQILIIKGTETSFYIPPNGIEVIPINNNENKGYVREAVTLERLEYCILKDENGTKRYIHGPAVVFPEPSESFVTNNNEKKYRAIELSEISGVYVKVIADYKDEDGTEHKTGEELFITGNEQMIYYPRPEHTFITYDNKVTHHAIAIPKGEGRYILNRLTGDIKTVHGPAMYLPDPRKEVVVHRTLTKKQCDLWYPGNQEVLNANGYDLMRSITPQTDYIAKYCATAGTMLTDVSSNIGRLSTYTEPRTINFDSSKYQGAVSLDIWTGYAVNVISKDGTRKVVCGPQTVLLDYDQTLEMLSLSTGKPKTTDMLTETVYLKHENNRISDIINIETSDFVNASIKVSYLVSFDKNKMDQWFAVDNYVKHLCDRCRTVLKEAARTIDINTLCKDYTSLVKDSLKDHLTFDENGMQITSIEVLNLDIEGNIQSMIDEHQEDIIEKTLSLATAERAADIDRRIIELQTEKVKLDTKYQQFKLEQEDAIRTQELLLQNEYNEARDAEAKRVEEARKALRIITNEILDQDLEQEKKKNTEKLEFSRQNAAIKSKAEADSAEAMATLLAAISPDLAAALNNKNNQATISAIAEAISPYSMAKNEGVADAVNRLVRGTALEDVIKSIEH